VIKFFQKLFMFIIWPLVLFQLMIVSGCSNESQFSCGYDPALYKTKGGLLVNINNANIDTKEFTTKIEQFGLKNNFCIANGSRYYDSEYLVNIQIVKDDYSFHVYGAKKYHFGFEVKSINVNMNTDIEKFCQLIYSHIDTDKIKHYETGKLCE